MTPLGLPEERPASPDRAVLVVPHAGGGSAVASPLRAVCPPSWLVAGVMFGGRESRFADEPPDSLSELVSDVASAATDLAALTGLTPVLVGQCSGALLAWLAALHLAAEGQPVAGLVLISRAAPSCQGAIPDPAAPDERFAAELVELGGVPAEVAAMPELFMLLLPALRADFACLAEWVPGEAGRAAPLFVPALAISSDTDSGCPEPAVAAWREHLPGLRVARVPGGHFLLNHDPEQVAACLVGWPPLR
jgi:pyochelin biosynthetic protein PchC